MICELNRNLLRIEKKIKHNLNMFKYLTIIVK